MSSTNVETSRHQPSPENRIACVPAVNQTGPEENRTW